MDEGICNSEISLNVIAKNMDFSANVRRRPCLPHEKNTLKGDQTTGKLVTASL